MEKQAATAFKDELNAMFTESRAAGRPQLKTSPAKSPAKTQPRTVLVVDDNKDYRELVKHLLSVNHYNVLEAGNGEEALSVINTLSPDLALVDYNMPKMNGYELIQEVRSNFDTRKMRIIMFTGASNRQHLKTLNMDIFDFLEKPVSNAKLLESVAKAFGGSGAQPAAARGQAAPKPALVKPAPAVPVPVKSKEPVQPLTKVEIERFGLPAAGVEELNKEQLRIEPPPPSKEVRAAPPIELPKEAAQPPGPAPARPAAEEPEAAQEQEAVQEPEAVPEVTPEAAPEAEPIQEMEDVFTTDDTHELELIDAGAERRDEAQENAGLENLKMDSPLIQMVNKILIKAVELRASDIHMEPQENRVTVRVRVDGVLKPLTTLPISIHSRLTARIKIMSSLVITERRLPQDGQFRVQIKGQKIEFRVSTLPCIKGEKIVLRILGQSKLNADLSHLDLTPRESKAVEGVLKSPNGLILVTGPTGSGKTTTLYTMINVLNKPDVNIMTAEDPVEYEVPNVNQVKIRPAVGLTFESTLRAFLRQDPDIMLVGEIRDLETAEIAIKASITGHLVFSTLHTNSAPATVVRLTHMGVAPYLVAASVKMVIAQRLVRLLCTRCRVPGRLSDEDRKFLTEEEAGRLKAVYHGPGCPHCHQTGYLGRKALFEIMPVESSAMRQLITASYNVDMLNELAAREGMTTLRQAALNCVAQGVTSMQEALKIMMG